MKMLFLINNNRQEEQAKLYYTSLALCHFIFSKVL